MSTHQVILVIVACVGLFVTFGGILFALAKYLINSVPRTEFDTFRYAVFQKFEDRALASVNIHNSFATKEEVKELEGELRGEFKETRKELAEFRRENSEQAKYALVRIDTMNNTLANVLRALSFPTGKSQKENHDG